MAFTFPINPARKHIYAWYIYAFASEVFSACAMAIFLPITLEQMAREVGYISPGLVVPCLGVDMGDNDGEGVVSTCKAKILGRWVDTASFSMYVKSIAVAVQALAIVFIGPSADSPYWRKKLLIIFAYLGSASGISLLFFPSHPKSWIPVLAAVLTILGNVGYATSIVCANAFLPGLAREDVDVVAAQSEGPGYSRMEEDVRDEEGRLLLSRVESGAQAVSTADLVNQDETHLPLENTNRPTDSRYTALLSLTTSRISSTGTALGFFSGVAVLALLTIPVSLGGGSTASLRLAIGLSGIWWAVFTLPCAVGLPSGEGHATKGTLTGEGSLGRRAWGRVWKMISPKEMKRLPNLFTFLLAWIFLSDGFHTTTYTAILYASSTLRMPPSRIIIIGILVQLAAVGSSIYIPRLQRRNGYTNLEVLLRVVLLALILPIYTCVGLLLPFGGLRTESEMYVAATWFGLLYGPFNSYSRAVYAELIPLGQESSYFSLFALTDKSASFLGPFIVGVIADITGNIRLGFLFLLVMLLIPVPVLMRLRVN